MQEYIETYPPPCLPACEACGSPMPVCLAGTQTSNQKSTGKKGAGSQWESNNLSTKHNKIVAGSPSMPTCTHQPQKDVPKGGPPLDS